MAPVVDLPLDDVLSDNGYCQCAASMPPTSGPPTTSHATRGAPRVKDDGRGTLTMARAASVLAQRA